MYGSGHDAAAEKVIGEAADSITRGYPAGTAIRHARAGLDRARAGQATRERLAAAGIQVVTGQQRARLGWPRLYGDTAPHAEAGCLAALIGWSGEAEHVCTNPATHAVNVVSVRHLRGLRAYSVEHARQERKEHVRT